MFDKIKNWLLAIGGAIIAFLAILLGFKNRKIDKLKTEGKVKDVVIKETGIAKDMESEHSEKIAEIKTESSETIEDVKNGKKSYNDVIDDWNADS